MVMITSSADFVLELGMRIDRHAAAIVANGQHAIVGKLDLDEGGVACDRFVHRIVENFGGQMMKGARSSVPPIYMPGRRRTGSSPSRTSMSLAE